MHSCLFVSSTVLWLQGSLPQPQPLKVGQDDSFLLWNGDIFSKQGAGESPLSENCQSDTEELGEKLALCKTDHEICETFSALRGPRAFVYYRFVHCLLSDQDCKFWKFLKMKMFLFKILCHLFWLLSVLIFLKSIDRSADNALFYGKDYFGRHSLLKSFNSNSLVLSSGMLTILTFPVWLEGFRLQPFNLKVSKALFYWAFLLAFSRCQRHLRYS